MSDWFGEAMMILILCSLFFFGGVMVQKHWYRQACGDILMSYTDGYRDCKEGK